MANKKGWYDGHFYDRFIAPNQDSGFKEIRKIIPGNSTVIDIGCGTGRLLESILKNKKDIKYTGIDISEKLIDEARKNLKNNSLKIALIN